MHIFLLNRREKIADNAKKNLSLLVKKQALRFILMCLTVISSLSLVTGTAQAYNGNAATAYADNWALSRNSAWPSYGSDCTNFLSQALNAGGDGMDTSWYAHNILGQWLVSLDWDNASSNHNYETSSGRGTQVAVLNANNSNYFNDYNAIWPGDMLYFDWGQGEGLSHAAVQVNSGYSWYDGSWYGDLSDQHVTDRKHVSWSHIEVNADWSTTTIYEVHHK